MQRTPVMMKNWKDCFVEQSNISMEIDPNQIQLSISLSCIWPKQRPQCSTVMLLFRWVFVLIYVAQNHLYKQSIWFWKTQFSILVNEGGKQTANNLVLQIIIKYILFQAFCSLLKRDMSLNFKSKGNSLVSVCACSILMAAFSKEENWPDDFVKVSRNRVHYIRLMPKIIFHVALSCLWPIYIWSDEEFVPTCTCTYSLIQ